MSLGRGPVCFLGKDEEGKSACSRQWGNGSGGISSPRRPCQHLWEAIWVFPGSPSEKPMQGAWGSAGPMECVIRLLFTSLGLLKQVNSTLSGFNKKDLILLLCWRLEVWEQGVAKILSDVSEGDCRQPISPYSVHPLTKKPLPSRSHGVLCPSVSGATFHQDNSHFGFGATPL